jgi:hypothetical protein
MTEIEKILIQRDGMTEGEARETLEGMRERVQDWENPEEVLMGYGLEVDYLMELLG